jgi:hypothetical protein
MVLVTFVGRSKVESKSMVPKRLGASGAIGASCWAIRSRFLLRDTRVPLPGAPTVVSQKPRHSKSNVKYDRVVASRWLTQGRQRFKLVRAERSYVQSRARGPVLKYRIGGYKRSRRGRISKSLDWAVDQYRWQWWSEMEWSERWLVDGDGRGRSRMRGCDVGMSRAVRACLWPLSFWWSLCSPSLWSLCSSLVSCPPPLSPVPHLYSRSMGLYTGLTSGDKVERSEEAEGILGFLLLPHRGPVCLGVHLLF